MTDTIVAKLEKIINIIIKGTIFLLPLFFLPWASESFEFNKQFLLWFLTPLAALLWLGKMAAEKRAKIKINPLNLPILIFLALTAAASLFGLDRFSSFFGHFGRFSDAWLGLLSLAIFYFLIINTEAADSAKKIIGLLKLSLYSAFAAAILSLAAILGWLGALGGGYSSIFSSASFSPAGGSLLNLGIFLAVMSVIAAGFLFNGPPAQAGGLKKSDRIFFSACLIIFLFVLALIDFSLSWALLLLGSGLLILFRLPVRQAGFLAQGFDFKKVINFYWLIPLALMLLAVLMLAWPGPNLAKIVLGRELPKEILLGYGQSLTITKEALRKNPALGSGPGTFSADFSLFRPTEMNSGAFWQVRFDKSRSQILEILAAAGLLGGLSYFLIIFLVIYLNIILIKKYLAGWPDRRAGPPGSSAAEQAPLADEDYNLIAVLFTVFILIFCAQIFFLTNTVLNFIFWFCLGLIIAFWQRNNSALFKEKITNLHKTALFYRLSLLVLFILSLAVLTLMFFAARFFAADLLAARGAGSETELTTAIKLNPYRFNYRISLAEFYLNQARAEALKPIGQINNLKVQANISQAIETARRALALAPNSVLPRETMAMIYRDIGPMALGGEPWAVKYFSSALELEPTNPVLTTELAKAYLNNNDSASAEKYFLKALELKSDYYEAKFALAKIYLKSKRDNQALILLTELASQAPGAEVYYELGRFYYNHGEIDKAADRFQLVLSFSPQHANSLYSLAVVYEAKGDLKEALKYYQQVLELNPGNAEVEKKVKELSR